MSYFNIVKCLLTFLKGITRKEAILTICFLTIIGVILKDEVKNFIILQNILPADTAVKMEMLIFCFGLFVILFISLRSKLKKSEENKIDLFSSYLKDSLELEYVLNDIVKKYGLDYINVNLFHNGTISASGYHFTKMSCIAEGKKPGSLPKIQELQNRVIDPFKEKIAETKVKGFVYLKNLPEDDDAYFSKAIPTFGIYSVFYVGLFDPRKKDSSGQPHFIGFISFAWEKPTNFKERDLVSMMKERERITDFILK